MQVTPSLYTSILNASNRLKRPVKTTFSGSRSHPEMPLDKDVHAFRKELEALSSVDLAYDADTYESRKALSPLTGLCGPVAYAFQQKHGGDIVKGRVTFLLNGEEHREPHVWNRLDGREFDLAGTQYGGDGLNALDSEAFLQSGQPKVLKLKGLSIEVVKITHKKYQPTLSKNPRINRLMRLLAT